MQGSPLISFKKWGLYNNTPNTATYRTHRSNLSVGSTKESLSTSIGIAREEKGSWPPTCLAFLVVLCLERRCPNPNTVARLKSKYMAPPKNSGIYKTFLVPKQSSWSKFTFLQRHVPKTPEKGVQYKEFSKAVAARAIGSADCYDESRYRRRITRLCLFTL